MNAQKMKEQAADILSCSIEKIEEKEVDGLQALYYRNVDRGGGAVVISEDGEMLFEDPFFTEYSEHVRKFKDGERSVFE